MILSLEPSYGDNEAWEARTERMKIVAHAIDDAANKATCSADYAIPSCEKKWAGSKKELAVLLVTKGYWESRFAKNVHEGKCRAQECDAIVVAGKIQHLARSPWQIQRAPSLVSVEEYKQMNSATIEGTKVSANVATRYLSMGLNTCHNIKGAISMYGGAGCNWEGSAGRYSFFNTLMAKSEKDFEQEANKRKSALEARLDRETKAQKK
jgi:hypothetical protein